MGNNLSRPELKERPLAFVRRKLGLMTRKDKIDRLVSLTVLNNEEKLRRFAAKANLTEDELQIYYDKIEALVGEYCTDIPEIEYRSVTTTPESEVISLSSTTSSSASDSSPSAIDQVYEDPETQKEFEEFCRLQYGKKKDNQSKQTDEEYKEKTEEIDTQRTGSVQIGVNIKDKTIISHGNDGALTLERVVPKPMSGGDVKSSTSYVHQDATLKLPVTQSPVHCTSGVSPTKRPSRMLGKINKGLLSRKDGRDKAKPRRSVAPPEKCPRESVTQDHQVSEKVSITPKMKIDTESDSEDHKPGFIRRCIDNLKRRTESVLSNKHVIEVKPATPDNTVKNHNKNVFKKKTSQTNLRPDRGIVWPIDLEGLSPLNKAYYVEQFLRTELFKQRCKRKQKGGKTWMNGLSKFQMWVIENEGTEAIDAVIDIIPKNKTNAKAKIKCWRGDTPPPPEC